MSSLHKHILFVPEEFDKTTNTILFPKKLVVLVPVEDSGNKDLVVREYYPSEDNLTQKCSEANSATHGEVTVDYSDKLGDGGEIRLRFDSGGNRWVVVGSREGNEVDSQGNADFTLQNGSQPKIRVLNI